jgi:lipopolysaccharide transport system ATP-binding protein
MPEAVITVENLSKSYLVGHRSDGKGSYKYIALRDVVGRELRNFARKAGDVLRGRQVVQGDEVEEFWALKDVSFEVKQGEVLGIIGRNGAGKSTLLKILSRITEPTEGRVVLRGRVGSLLEVGTGFHPELTGRENIFLNGAILGMTQREIRKKFDEIVAFAEVEKFLDTPVKRYSSGMYVRLAFAVAAHLEPEILIVDEVLAVGDIEFQKKCLGKMQNVASHGRTVLVVSHNMAMVGSLCTRGIVLAKGHVVFQGAVARAISKYSGLSSAEYSIDFAVNPECPSILQIHVDRTALQSGDLVVDIAFESPWPLQRAVGGIMLRAATGEPVWGSNGRFHSPNAPIQAGAKGVLRCVARGIPVVPGQYLLSAWLADWHEVHDSKLDVLSVHIRENCVDPRRPPSSAIGCLDWPAVWSNPIDDVCNLGIRSDSEIEPETYYISE